MARRRRTEEEVEQDFLNKYNHTPTATGCLEWTATLDKRGYGVLQIGKKQWRANRYAYLREHGELPDKLLICHRCNNKKCVNVAHLYAGTDADNGRDKADAGIHKGMLNGRAKLSNEEVLEIRRLYATGEYTQVELAKQFGTIQTRISAIVTETQWKHLPKE